MAHDHAGTHAHTRVFALLCFGSATLSVRDERPHCFELSLQGQDPVVLVSLSVALLLLRAAVCVCL